jgi:putative selenium metabolism protein SsnA
MDLVLTNALLLHLDPLRVESGGVRVEGESITDAGAHSTPREGDEVVDCGGAVVMPGLVNGHTHLYSALAVGMPPPPRTPKNFHEILELIWWRLDRALDGEAIEISGAVGALGALRCGTTTLIDHHASPNCISGSLDRLARGIDSVGLRSVLCYETTDRNGMGGAEEGLTENHRYLEKCRVASDGRHAAMVGAHAAFTLSDASLRSCVELAAEFAAGVHIHVAEDPCDDAICREKYGAPLVARLARCGLVDPGQCVASASILAHGTHLSPEDARALSSRVAAVAHNPRSNMNNRVGYAPIAHLSGVQLGTDGIGSDMLAEARAAWFIARHEKTELSPFDVVAMLAASARTASRLLGRTVGKLERGAAADVIITDYTPPTPLNDDSAVGHLIFGLGSQHVRDVIIGGQWRLQDRRALGFDEAAIAARGTASAQAMWGRLRAM